MDTAAERDTKRADIASTNNAARDAIEKAYVSDKRVREAQYHSDINANRLALRNAYVAADLNPDGSDPQERQQGL